MNYLDAPCGHAPTPEEKDRDSSYLGCFAKEGEPCLWARRFDGVADPEAHSERIETFAEMNRNGSTISTEAILDLGLV